MSLSVRETALQAIKARLASTGSPAANTFRSRLEQIDDSELPCFDITPGDETIADAGEFGDHESITRTLPVTVRAMIDAAAAEGNPPAIDDSALDPFYVWAIQQMTGGGATLAGTVDNVEEVGHAAVFQPEGKAILGLEMRFELKFATQRGDPTQRA